MIAVLLLGLLIALGSLSILGWTANSRDDEQKLWPLERRHLDIPPTAPTRRDGSVGETRPDALATTVRDLPSRRTGGP
jgi:hypothetical protein